MRRSSPSLFPKGEREQEQTQLQRRSPPQTKKPTEQTQHPNAPTDISDIVSSSVTGASYLVLLQLFTRLTTFTLNQLLLRYTSPATLGIASVQLELLLNTILFLSREGFRCALLRGASDEGSKDGVDGKEENGGKRGKEVKDDGSGGLRTPPSAAVPSDSPFAASQKLVNLAYVPLALGIVTTIAVCGRYIQAPSVAENGKPPPHYLSSVLLYGSAAALELIFEPLYILAQNGLYFRVRVAAEGAATVVRCVVTLGMTLFGATLALQDNENVYGILSFAVAQFLYSCVMAVIYYKFWIDKIIDNEKNPSKIAPSDPENLSALVPRPIWDVKKSFSYYFDPIPLGLAKTFTQQSLLKHLLNEGDKMMISALCSAHDQGVYAFVINYGSLIVRILFGPLEETARILFSKLLSRVPNTDDVTAQTDDVRPSTSENEKLLTVSARLLANIMKCHLYLGLLFGAFGTNYTATLIDLLVGSNWSKGTTAPFTLSVYCLYIPVMGINGVTEAFVQAVATEKDLSRLSKAMIGFSAIFVAAGIVFMKVIDGGAVGLVAATALNLSVRIVWSLKFIRGYYSVGRCGKALAHSIERDVLSLKKVLPHTAVIAVCAVSWIITRTSETVVGWDSLSQKMYHIGIGAACFSAFVGVAFQTERNFFKELKHLVESRKDQ